MHELMDNYIRISECSVNVLIILINDKIDIGIQNKVLKLTLTNFFLNHINVCIITRFKCFKARQIK